MARRVAGLLAGLCALLVVVWIAVSAATGGTSPSLEGPAAAPTAWPLAPDVLNEGDGSPWSPVSAAAALEPTGIEL